MRPVMFSRSETMLGSGKITPAARKFFVATFLTDSLAGSTTHAEKLRRSPVDAGKNQRLINVIGDGHGRGGAASIEVAPPHLDHNSTVSADPAAHVDERDEDEQQEHQSESD